MHVSIDSLITLQISVCVCEGWYAGASSPQNQNTYFSPYLYCYMPI